jgi:hypothetical protein
VHRAQERVGRLALAVDHDELDAEPDASALDEVLGVRRFAHRRGRHGENIRRAGAERDGPKIVQRGQRPLDGERRQTSLVTEVAGQAQRRARNRQGSRGGRQGGRAPP